MDAADTFDVIYSFWEDDITPRWEQDTEVKDAIRTKAFELLFDKRYPFAREIERETTYGLPPGKDLSSIPELPEIPVESRNEIKPYVEPTDPSDFMDILGPPAN